MAKTAVEEKAYGAEKAIAHLRLATVIICTAAYVPFIRPRPETIQTLGDINLALLWVYVAFLYSRKPHQRSPLVSSYFTSVADAVVISVGVLATGGFDSPFFVIYYGAAITIAFRYSFWETVTVSSMYASFYLVLLASLGQVEGHLGDVIVRVGLIPIVGLLGGNFAREALKQTQAKVKLRDLAARLESEVAERTRAEDRLRQQTNTYEAMLTAQSEAGEGFTMVDVQTQKIVYANEAFCRISGYTEQELLSMPSFFTLVSSDELPRLREALRERLKGLPSQDRQEVAMVHRDGHLVEIEVGTKLMESDEGANMIAISRDVTERKQAERKLRETVEELQRSNADLRQFADVTAHDLQEPLRMITSYVQLLKRRYSDRLDSDADEFIDFAVGGAHRLQRLIDDLLTYSHLSATPNSLDEVDCQVALKKTLSVLELDPQRSEAVVTYDFLPVVKAHEAQLIRVFSNLVANAVKFRGPEQPRVHISARRRSGDWIFSVKDNGIGIDPQYAERIFVIFKRLHGNNTYPGTGIGLAICKKIIENHGGRIWVESELGKGATFYFTIPAKEGDGHEREIRKAS